MLRKRDTEHTSDQASPSSVDLLMKWIDEESVVDEADAVEMSPSPQTRREVRATLTRQERVDRKRAGRLVINVLKINPTFGQVIHVDSTMTRGRTSSLAIAIAQDNLRAHGLDTKVVLEDPAGNKNYEEAYEGDQLEPYTALEIRGIDDNRVNVTTPKHTR